MAVNWLTLQTTHHIDKQTDKKPMTAYPHMQSSGGVIAEGSFTSFWCNTWNNEEASWEVLRDQIDWYLIGEVSVFYH